MLRVAFLLALSLSPTALWRPPTRSAQESCTPPPRTRSSARRLQGLSPDLETAKRVARAVIDELN